MSVMNALRSPVNLGVGPRRILEAATRASLLADSVRA